MDEKAKKYVDLFRKVKIATAATVDAQGRPQQYIAPGTPCQIHWEHCLCGRCQEHCPADAIRRLHP